MLSHPVWVCSILKLISVCHDVDVVYVVLCVVEQQFRHVLFRLQTSREPCFAIKRKKTSIKIISIVNGFKNVLIDFLFYFFSLICFSRCVNKTKRPSECERKSELLNRLDYLDVAEFDDLPRWCTPVGGTTSRSSQSSSIRWVAVCLVFTLKINVPVYSWVIFSKCHRYRANLSQLKFVNLKQNPIQEKNKKKLPKLLKKIPLKNFRLSWFYMSVYYFLLWNFDS